MYGSLGCFDKPCRVRTGQGGIRGPNYLMFSDTIYYCPVQETNEIFNVPVSATETADRDRTFAVEVIDKESNAVEGKHYKILSNTVTIKAGERAANVEVEGLYENIGINDSLGFALRLPEYAFPCRGVTVL